MFMTPAMASASSVGTQDRPGDSRGGQYDRGGYDRDGYNRDGYGRGGYDRDGYNRDGYNRRGERRDYRYDRRNDRRCSIDLDRSGRVLNAEANTNARNQWAFYEVDFNTRNGRGDESGWVQLDNRGDAEGSFAIPVGADDVTVSLRVFGRGGVSCSESLDLDRR